MAVEAARAIKAATPRECVIGPTTATFDWDFIETTFKGGVLNYFDAVSVHPYRNVAPETAAPDYARLRTLNRAICAARPRNSDFMRRVGLHIGLPKERSETVQARFSDAAMAGQYRVGRAIVDVV